MKRVFFNSSLPRSGSSLFQNLVSDNPDFHCTPTSGFLELIYGAKGNFQSSPEFKAQDQALMENAFLNFCRGGFEWYFNALTDKPYVLDKNRGWGISYDLANKFYPNPKIVCVVRDLRAIFSSMEKNFRKNPHKENHVQNAAELVGTTVRKRVEIWANGLPVGIAIERLRDMIDQGIDKKVLFIRYEDLMSNPDIQMARFYDYLDIPRYEHSFLKVTQHTHENDAIHGIYGDHKLRPEFKMLPNDFNEVLGFELSEDIKKTYDWFFRYFNYI